MTRTRLVFFLILIAAFTASAFFNPARDAHIPFLAEGQDLVRANAAQSLGLVGDRSSVPALVHALDDPFAKVRSLSAHAIAKIAPDDASAKTALASAGGWKSRSRPRPATSSWR